MEAQPLKVAFFGKLADVLGPELEVPMSGECTVGDLRERIAADHPDAADTLRNNRVRACVGDDIVPDRHVLSPGMRVEFFPPVSGG